MLPIVGWISIFFFSFYHLTIDPKIIIFFIFVNLLTVKSFFKKHKKWWKRGVPESSNLIRKTLFVRVTFLDHLRFFQTATRPERPKCRKIVLMGKHQISDGRTYVRVRTSENWGSHGRNRRFAQKFISDLESWALLQSGSQTILSSTFHKWSLFSYEYEVRTELCWYSAFLHYHGLNLFQSITKV